MTQYEEEEKRAYWALIEEAEEHKYDPTWPKCETCGEHPLARGYRECDVCMSTPRAQSAPRSARDEESLELMREEAKYDRQTAMTLAEIEEEIDDADTTVMDESGVVYVAVDPGVGKTGVWYSIENAPTDTSAQPSASDLADAETRMIDEQLAYGQGLAEVTAGDWLYYHERPLSTYRPPSQDLTSHARIAPSWWTVTTLFAIAITGWALVAIILLTR